MMYFLLSLLVAFAVLFGSLMTTDKGRRSFGLALRSLWLHKLRSSLSVLGIVELHSAGLGTFFRLETATRLAD